MRNRRLFSRRATSFLALAALAATAARGDDALPKPFPANRYDLMSTHSPFSPPTVAPLTPVAVVAPTGTWTDKLAVTLLMQEGSTYVATIVDRDSSKHYLVTSDKENAQQMMLSSVQWGDLTNPPRVTIRRGTLFGQVAFDPTAGGGGSANAAQPGFNNPLYRPPIPGSPNNGAPNPGAALFHPPPGGQPGGRGGPITPSAVIRRPPIPAVLAPVNPRIVNGLNQQDSDDDDDDNN